MLKRLLLLFLAFYSVPAFSQTEDSLFIRRIADEILTSGKAYENLRILTKKVGGRLSGSSQMYKAEDWGISALRDAGADKTWKQDCQVTHWVRGNKEEAYVVQDGKKKIPFKVLALGNSVGTGKNGIKAPVILINSFDELESRKDEVKGKVVFYNYKFNPLFIKTNQSYGDAGKYRGSGPSRAAKYGAVAVLVRSMTHSTDNHAHTGSLSYNDSMPRIPAAAVGLRDADKLAAILEKGTYSMYLRTNAIMHPDTLGHNVIGELTGSEFPDEYITIGGHLDSWDVAEGAHDDGTGCVHSIEVLRALKAVGYKPRRTIRIVLFANEENGLKGGTAYATEAKKNNEKHYFALESDAGGFTPRTFGFSGSPEQLTKVRSYLPLLIPYGVYLINDGGGGADVGPLHQAFKTPVAGFEPDSQRYFDVHHAENDVFENVNKRELELGAINMAALIYLVDKYGL
jgi:carboxypeptidase Q